VQNIIAWFQARPVTEAAAGLAVLFFIAWLADRVAVRAVLHMVDRLVEKTTITWDNLLVQQRIPERVGHVVPVMVIYLGLPFVSGLTEAQVAVFRGGLGAVMIFVVALAASAALNGVNAIYSQSEGAADRPIKGYIQLGQIGLFVVAGILVISALTGQNPTVLLGGIGAFTAVLLLVFRDTILSVVASVQLTSNDMIRIGDWIEMPKYGADGDVMEIALHTVKVQNWDKTITTIPTHALIADSFRNWRGMSLSGGRRIKRALNLDMNSVRFLTPEEIEEMGRQEMLADYIAGKKEALVRWAAERSVPEGIEPEPRGLTNLGTFRAYLVNYLRRHSGIHQGMTLLVRQLPPGPEGIPMEIYTFAADTEWAKYEGLQADLFDHMLAVLPEFGLQVFQNPSGRDLADALGARRPPGQDLHLT
jgi:miniconductance mechanosensitive channel